VIVHSSNDYKAPIYLKSTINHWKIKSELFPLYRVSVTLRYSNFAIFRYCSVITKYARWDSLRSKYENRNLRNFL